MMRSILFAGACALAIPAIAQTTGQSTATNPTGMTTAPSSSMDHSMHGDSMARQGSQSPTTQSTDTMTDVNAGTEAETTTTTGTMATGTNAASSGGTMGQTGTTGTTGAGTGTSSTGTWGAGTGASSSGSSTYSGTGGPSDARDYPRCSRTVRDSCIQGPRRR